MAGKICKGAEYLITETSAADVFTPEDFSDEQKQIGETTEQFVTNEVIPRREEIEHQSFPLVVDLMRKCGGLGLLTVNVRMSPGTAPLWIGHLSGVAGLPEQVSGRKALNSNRL